MNVAGIDLKDYRLNPVWHHNHDFNKPIGRSARIDKTGGKLTGVLELGVGVYEPDASWVQRALSSNMLRGCSIGFLPIRWSHNESRDGIDFHECSLTEISTCTVPCAPAAIIHGPAKSLKEQAAELRKIAAADRAYVEREKRMEALEKLHPR